MNKDKLGIGKAELSMPYKEILESNKFVHGGAIACLADAAIACAISTKLSSESQIRNLRTVELTVHYLDEVSRDKIEIIAKAECVLKAKRISVGEAELVTGIKKNNKEEREPPFAKAIGTYYFK